MPIDKVRKNLRFELIIQTIAMISFGFIPMGPDSSTNDCTVLFNLCNHGR
jgi:hypothetical protein